MILHVSQRIKEPKLDIPCPYCGKGTLTPSPSGANYVCPKCGRIVISKLPKTS